jgi:hypothetical protein
MIAKILVGGVMAIGLVPSSVSAQTKTPSQSTTRITGGGYIAFGSTVLAARQTFEALSLNGIYRRLLIDVSVSSSSIEGERVFVDGSAVYRLSVPLKIKLQPFDILGGWSVPFGRWKPYFAAGVSVAQYTETSDFAVPGDDVNETSTGFALLGGVNLSVFRLVAVGGEVRYRHLPGVFGMDGASQAFGEDQLGGFSLAFRVTVGR